MSFPTTPPTPESASNTPPEQQQVRAPGLRVTGRAASETTSSPIPSPTTSPGDDAAAESWPADPIDHGDGTRSSGRDEPRPTVKVDRSAVKDIARGMVASVGLFLHRHFAASDAERDSELWIATEADQRQIGDPAASIAARHGIPLGSGGADASDIVAIAIGVAGYLVRNGQQVIAARVARRRARKAGVPAYESPEPAPASS